jgi:hypothetical protein
MKELLTKKFWQDVKKTFDEAREEIPPNRDNSSAASKCTEAAETPPAVEQPSRE